MNACRYKCPCRLWVNCSYYINQQRQIRRLKSRTNEEISRWFDDFFRAGVSMPDVSAGGW
ncbi:MAG TPA: hypothetical protein VIO58_15465 [Candidatus Methanoperedens sp.]